MFNGKEDGLSGSTESAGALRQCGMPVAAKIKLGASLEV